MLMQKYRKDQDLQTQRKQMTDGVQMREGGNVVLQEGSMLEWKRTCSRNNGQVSSRSGTATTVGPEPLLVAMVMVRQGQWTMIYVDGIGIFTENREKVEENLEEEEISEDHCS